ncbi:MAG: fructose PTS transporter subunit IIA [Elusimicrobiota bacterium]|jgi:PTS system fructose-specific IIA component|nr:fructose PTS transporter subunit IIA [Elusimicrobiota bacterium]
MEILTLNNIQVGVKAKNIKEVFEVLAEMAVNNGYANSKEGIIKGFFEREKLGTTGMESGFAIPHVINEAVDNAGVLILKLANQIPIDQWETFDGKPVDFIISLLAPKGAGQEHLKILSKLSSLLVHEDFQIGLKAKQSPQEICDFLAGELSKKG